MEQEGIPKELFDLDGLLDRLGNDLGLVEILVRNALVQIPLELGRLKDAMDTSRWEDARSFAHKIKGIGLNLNFTQVAQYGAQFERTFKGICDGAIPDGPLNNTTLELFQERWAQLEAYLRTSLDPNS